jgi:hypothetical protein
MQRWSGPQLSLGRKIGPKLKGMDHPTHTAYMAAEQSDEMAREDRFR